MQNKSLRMAPWKIMAGIVIMMFCAFEAFAFKVNGSPNSPKYSALMNAIERDDLEAVHIALDRGADVNGLPEAHRSENISPLVRAAEKGNIKIVRLLIERGADVNQPDDWNFTPLGSARAEGHKDVERLLLASGAKE